MRIIHAPVASEQHTLIFDSIFPPLQHTTTKRKLEFIIKTLIAHHPIPRLVLQKDYPANRRAKNRQSRREEGCVGGPPTSPTLEGFRWMNRNCTRNSPHIYVGVWICAKFGIQGRACDRSAWETFGASVKCGPLNFSSELILH